MFTAEERDGVRQQLLERAEADSAITGAASTGSHAAIVPVMASVIKGIFRGDHAPPREPGHSTSGSFVIDDWRLAWRW